MICVMKKYLSAILLLFVCVPSYCSETLSNLITDARVLSSDASSSTRQRFSDSQVTEFINIGQREMLASNHCLQQNSVFSLLPGTTYYSLPQNYITITRVTIGSKYIPEQSPAALDGKSRGWEVASGYPTYYFVNFSSRGLVGFAPWPATSTDTDTVKVEYDIQANDLVNSTDLPFNGINELQDFHHTLAYYAAALMCQIQNLGTQAQSYMSLFQLGQKLMNDHCTERSNYYPSGVAIQ